MKVKIGNITSTIKSQLNPFRFADEYFNYYSLPDYDLNGEPSLTVGKEIQSNKNLIKNGTLLISKLNPRIRRVWQVKTDDERRNIASTEFIALVPNDGTDFDYLFYVVQNDDLFKYLENCAIGSTNSHTRFKARDIEQSYIFHPSIIVQRKIASILSTVDKQIEKTEELIRKYEMVKEGMMQDLFSRGIDVKTGKLRPTYEEAPELYKHSELGLTPKEWEVKMLSEICDMRSGDGITSVSISNYGDYPVYGGNGLRGYNSNYTHDGNFVLIGRQGALCGNVLKVNGKFFASEHAVVVTTNNSTNVNWIAIKLDLMKLNQYSEASAQPGLSVSKIMRLRIPVPSLSEQELIAQAIQSIINRHNTEKIFMSYIENIKKGLMQDLLTGKSQVKV